MELEGLYSGRWYRAAVTGVDGAGAHLLYLDSGDTEVLGPADFEPMGWRVRGGCMISDCHPIAGASKHRELR